MKTFLFVDHQIVRATEDLLRDRQIRPKNCSRLFRLFWLHFVDGQLKVSNDFVLKTETRKGTSFEVATLVNELLEIAKNREHNQHIPVNAIPHFEALSRAEQNDARTSLGEFYEALTTYLEKWSNSLDGTEIFSWMSLLEVPDWRNDIEPSLKYAQECIEPGLIDGDGVFDEVPLLQQVINAKLPAWTAEKVSSEQRWIETFEYMNQKNRPLKQFSLLVEFAFAIPGTSTEVERLFSVINDVWTPQKGQMLMPTLEAHLNIIMNSDLDCEQYYRSVEKNNSFLAKVHSNEKYSEEPQTQPTASSSSQASTSSATPIIID